MSKKDEFIKEKMYKLIRKYLGKGKKPQTKIFNDILSRLIELFDSPELKRRLENNYSEKEAYIKYIKPLINGEKYFPFETGIFFASIIMLIASTSDYDEYIDDLSRGKLADDDLSENWITKIYECENIFIEMYLDSKYNDYLLEKQSKISKANKIDDLLKRNKKHEEIKQKYSDTKDIFIEKKRQALNQQLEIQFLNLNAVAYNLAMINSIESDYVMYQKNLETMLNLIKYLPVDRKDKLCYNINDNINLISDILVKHLEDWENELQNNNEINVIKSDEYKNLKASLIKNRIE
jgi:hypothetical protein